MSINLFKPSYRIEECLDEIRHCLEIGWTGAGYKTVEFEEKWKEYTGYSHAHYVNSATAGLHLAVKALKMTEKWQDGDEIISTPLTFVSTNHAVLYENLKVTFADVDEYLCLDPEDVERKITDRTRAIIFVGFGGNTGQYQKILKLAKKHNLRLILDAAHMGGTRLNGKTAGLDADVTVYSFQAVKNLPTGDSGMICFQNAECDKLVRQLAWLGINKDTYTRSQSKGAYVWQYEVENVGFKYNGNSIMAAVGLVQLRYLDQDNAYRRQLAAWYDEGFARAGDLVKPVPVARGCESSRHLYVIEVDDRDELMLALHKSEIYPGVHYRDNTEYPMYSYAHGSCPNCHTMSKKVISLPMHMDLKKEDVEMICREVLRYAGE